MRTPSEHHRHDRDGHERPSLHAQRVGELSPELGGFDPRFDKLGLRRDELLLGIVSSIVLAIRVLLGPVGQVALGIGAGPFMRKLLAQYLKRSLEQVALGSGAGPFMRELLAQ